MLNAYLLKNRHLVPLDVGDAGAPLAGAVWVDLIDPSDEEREAIERLYRQELPETDEVEEIEASARFFEDERGLHIHSLFLHDVEGRPRNTTVAFTLSPGRLLTLRERQIPAFRLLRMRARRRAEHADSPLAILLTLFEIKIEDLADHLEEVYTGLEELSARVLERQEASPEEEEFELEDALDELARLEDLNGKVRLCLLDGQRALTFLLRRGRLEPESRQWVNELLRDIDSLLPHSSFLFEKVNFLMDAAQGFINIEQNQIIKIFSIAAVVFLPPTLVASIYGMNFRHMPELDWPWGYPLALALMVVSGVAPYWFFKKKGWL